jgi:hypothetical protein
MWHYGPVPHIAVQVVFNESDIHHKPPCGFSTKSTIDFLFMSVKSLRICDLPVAYCQLPIVTCRCDNGQKKIQRLVNSTTTPIGLSKNDW